ncbi:beta-N-acetylglucosaminidase domain-containing protein [Streptomyces sp. CBMA152]|uniref:beta-N-acetylglucosaminidase domain-containing protein n=1 Tax=Streptomyces sp. CBMA152 TaxID=1896312 RepID=UPI0016605ED8|nr:beta-N-acetylglucosaminidase domain-containing protein [Streptomyces sp. CBMA152]MBD0747355.1 hyaluronidase [Streptomyces sp. CBMA152]
MRFGRGRRATALAVAVIGGLLGAAPGALAAPTGPWVPDQPTTGPSTEAGQDSVPAVWPRPQSVKRSGSGLSLGSEAVVVADPGADPYAVSALGDVLDQAGVTTIHDGLAGNGPVFVVGGAGAQDALRALRVPERGDLPSGGYRIGVGRVGGRDTVALDGVGDDGLFHAVQTLRQLVGKDARGDATVPGVSVRDWPATAVRGTTEGFYGQPWTPEQRLGQLDFMGRTKQNRYLYAPGDDPYRQAQWRDPYPADQRAAFRTLAARAAANHVTLAWAVAPGQEMCLSSDGDVKALLRKLDAMWALGVRAFQLQFQDVSYSEWHCGQDKKTFGKGPAAAARAHARVANAVAAHLAERYPGSQPLSLMPTEYYQDGATTYRGALADGLDARVQVAWTGVGVVPRTITGRELAGARAAFGHPLVTMDNYPVNDWAPGRIFLGPYTGREPAVATGSAALLANAMEQASASRIPLFTAADYAWNPQGYEPEASWRAAIADLAGGDAPVREALTALAGNDSSSVLSSAESAYLRPLLDAFWQSRGSADPSVRDAAAARLRSAFTVMRQTPDRLAADSALADEVRPWSDRLSRYGRAGEVAVDMLQAQAHGHGAAAWRAALALEPLRQSAATGTATVGKGVLDAFLARAADASAAWTGADRPAGTVTVSPDAYTVGLGRVRPVEALTVMDDAGFGPGPAVGPGSGPPAWATAGAPAAPVVGPGPVLAAARVPWAEGGALVQVHVPGQGWRSVGPLSGDGWTQAAAGGVLADAVRVTGPSDSVQSVRHLIPWFADEPRARFELAKDATDAEIGGKPQRVAAVLTSTRPGDVRGTLTARAPRGIGVTLPGSATVPRGATSTVPVEVTVAPGTPAGEYRVPVSFAGQERTLTVKAYPRTVGPDLIAGAAASSSGDETPAFPARAAADGDPSTRWSSPAVDNAWWQAELPARSRVGLVVLNWQDAYASAYTIQTSPDGRTWRTAATVRDGKGGREAVRMDARDARFLRIQGVTRATPYGYSLWSVEAYAVAAP